MSKKNNNKDLAKGFVLIHGSETNIAAILCLLSCVFPVICSVIKVLRKAALAEGGAGPVGGNRQLAAECLLIHYWEDDDTIQCVSSASSSCQHILTFPRIYRRKFKRQ